MSYYVYGTRVSYGEYLQAKSFVTDIRTGQRTIEHAVSRQTREIIASQEELHAQGMKVLAFPASANCRKVSKGFPTAWMIFMAQLRISMQLSTGDSAKCWRAWDSSTTRYKN